MQRVAPPFEIHEDKYYISVNDISVWRCDRCGAILYCGKEFDSVSSESNSKQLLIFQHREIETEYFAQWIDPIRDLFKEVMSKLLVTKASTSQTVSINLNIDLVNQTKVSAYAKRSKEDKNAYDIRLNAGLSSRFWTASRRFTIDASPFQTISWIEECIIDKRIAQEVNKKEILAQYSFYISIVYVLFHEISHVVLGHLDYLNDAMNLQCEYLSEFQDEKIDYSPEEVKIRKAFEADADRQAGKFTVGFFEKYLLGESGLGTGITFPSRKHAYEFYIYTMVNVFVLLQDLTEKQSIVHPSPHIRLYILQASLSKYFKQHIPNEHDEIYSCTLASCLKAGEKLFLADSSDPMKIIQGMQSLSFIDRLLDEINISHYSHNVTEKD
jgi:hypothetical protein